MRILLISIPLTNKINTIDEPASVNYYEKKNNIGKDEKHGQHFRYKVERMIGLPNVFYEVAIPEVSFIEPAGEENPGVQNNQNYENGINNGCINCNTNIFLLAKSALEMNCYLLIFSFSVLPQTISNIYYRNCGIDGDCYGYYSLTTWFIPLRLFGHIFPPAIAWYRIKKNETHLI